MMPVTNITAMTKLMTAMILNVVLNKFDVLLSMVDSFLRLVFVNLRCAIYLVNKLYM